MRFSQHHSCIWVIIGHYFIRELLDLSVAPSLNFYNGYSRPAQTTNDARCH